MKKEDKEREQQEKDNAVVQEIYRMYREHPLHGTEYWRRKHYDGYFYMGSGGNVEKKSDRIVQISRKQKGSRYLRVNYVKPNTLLAINKMFSPPPQVVAVPMPSVSGDQEDKEVATLATDISEYAHYNERCSLLREARLAMNYAFRHGTGWVYIFWNPNIMGWEIDGDGYESNTIEGDYDLEVLDDYRVYPQPPSAKSWRALTGIIVAKLVPLEPLREAYPEQADQIMPYAESNPERERFQYVPSRQTAETDIDKNALLIIYFERPSPKRKNGRKVIVCNNNILLENEDNPYAEFGQLHSLPVVPFFWDKNGDRFHGVSGIEGVIGVQKTINDIATSITESIKETSMPEKYLPAGSNIKKMSGTPRIYEYNPQMGAVPIFNHGSPLPEHVMNWLYSNVGFLGDLMYVKEVLTGVLPKRGSQMAARALQMLMEAAEMQTAHNTEELTLSLIHCTWIIVKMIRKYYKEERLLKFASREGRRKVIMFKGDGKKGSKLYRPFDISLMVASGLDRQPAAKAELWLKLWQEGIIQAKYQTEDIGLRKAGEDVMRALEFGSDSEISGIDKLQEQVAHKHLLLAINKVKKPEIKGVEGADKVDGFVEDYIPGVHDPRIHLRVFLRFTLTEDFDDLSDEIRAAIVGRIQEFQSAINAEQQPQQPQGQPPPPTAPGPQDMAEGFPGYPPGPTEMAPDMSGGPVVPQ